MCNVYAPPSPEVVAEYFQVDLPIEPYKPGIGPWGHGPFVRMGTAGREAVVGQWALIGDKASEARSSARIMTNNARWETVATKPTFRGPWQRSQRCLVPAESFIEPNWELGTHVPWRFRRANGDPWALAGLWNTWTDKATGEIVESYTLLTMNADAHPLMSRMHKPDSRLPADQQDKRTVVAIEPADFDTWLTCPPDQADRFRRLTPVDQFAAGPDR